MQESSCLHTADAFFYTWSNLKHFAQCLAHSKPSAEWCHFIDYSGQTVGAMLGCWGRPREARAGG